jgi:hypothetical protein
VRNVLVLERCSPRRPYNVDDGEPDGLKVYTLCRVKTIHIAAISVMITPVNYFILASLPLCFAFLPQS